jgi:hypothetical protein
MPSDALSQFLARVTELKRSLMTGEVGWLTKDRPGCPYMTEIAMQAIRRDIAEYERAITALIPRRQDA